MPFGGTVTIDDVESGQTAAAFGGTTTHVDFCIQGKGQTFADALADWHAKADGKQVIDMGYHIAVTDLTRDGALDELATLPDQGVTSYKLFMAYKGALMVDDETLFRTMEVAAETGALVMVHAENGDAIDVLVKQALADGHTEPHWHALHAPARDRGRGDEPRDPAGARRRLAAVRRPRLVQGVGRADRRCARERAGTSGARPARSTSSSTTPSSSGRTSRARSTSTRRRRATRRTRTCSGTRCAPTCSRRSRPTTARSSWDGQKTLGQDDFSKIPNGGPGLENRLQMIHHFGVREGRITLNRMVELLATNPAKLFGLYPRKGTLAVGSDADIVVFDPEKRVTISAATHHSRVRLQPLRGHRGGRLAEIVLLRGNVLVEDGELVASPGIGRYVARAKFGEELAGSGRAVAA